MRVTTRTLSAKAPTDDSARGGPTNIASAKTCLIRSAKESSGKSAKFLRTCAAAAHIVHMERIPHSPSGDQGVLGWRRPAPRESSSNTVISIISAARRNGTTEGGAAGRPCRPLPGPRLRPRFYGSRTCITHENPRRARCARHPFAPNCGVIMNPNQPARDNARKGDAISRIRPSTNRRSRIRPREFARRDDSPSRAPLTACNAADRHGWRVQPGLPLRHAACAGILGSTTRRLSPPATPPSSRQINCMRWPEAGAGCPAAGCCHGSSCCSSAFFLADELPNLEIFTATGDRAISRCCSAGLRGRFGSGTGARHGRTLRLRLGSSRGS